MLLEVSPTPAACGQVIDPMPLAALGTREADLANVDQASIDAGHELPTRVAVVLVVDLVESVHLMALDERGVIARWQAFIAYVQQEVLPNTSGRLVKSLGDGLMAEFLSAPLAFKAACAMHQWMSERCRPISDGSRLMLRAGLHASKIFDTKLDIYGIGVNLAARITTLAEGGETVATVEARDLLSDSLDAEIDDLGDCHLKHIENTVRVYRLGPAQQPLSIPKTESYAMPLYAAVAVIPFTDQLSNLQSRGIGDILADGLIGQLSQSPGLHVVSRLSSACFRDRQISLAEVSASLAVRFVVSGTYTVIDGSITISAELSDAQSGHVAWSGRLSGDWRDLLRVDSELIHEIADTVHKKILESAVAKAVTRPLPTLDSYELFLAGISMMHRASAGDFDASHRLLESLTERHRRIALPYAWLGKWYVLRSIQGAQGSELSSATSMALERTHRALELEPSSALALAMEGFVYFHLRKDIDTAESRLRLACTVNPSEGFAWLFLGVLSAFKGESEEAVSAARRAIALSPMDPLRYYYESLMASCEFSAGNFREAIRWCESSRRRNRQHLSTLRLQIAALSAADRGSDARAVAGELLRMRPGYTVANYESHSVAVLYPFGQKVARAMREAGIP